MARGADPGRVRLLASPDAVRYVRERGGSLFVWIECLRCQGTVNFLDASTESPGPDRRFRRMSGTDFDLYLDTGEYEVPEAIHLELKGRRKKHLRAYWNGAVFASDPRPGDAAV